MDISEAIKNKMFNLRGKKIAFEFQSRNLSLNLEPGWIEYVDEDKGKYGQPLSFFKEKDGVGVLQISIATSTNNKNFNIDDALKNNNHEHITEVRKYKLRDWTVYEYEETKDARYVKYFQLTKLNVIVYTTYNCESDILNKKELNEAIKIVKTINVVSKN